MGSEALSEIPVASGGCQCGAVRFRVKGPLGRAHWNGRAEHGNCSALPTMLSAAFVPVVQWGLEGKLPYLDQLSALPAYTTERDPESIEFVRTLVSFQHSDHDTDTWPQ